MAQNTTELRAASTHVQALRSIVFVPQNGALEVPLLVVGVLAAAHNNLGFGSNALPDFQTLEFR